MLTNRHNLNLEERSPYSKKIVLAGISYRDTPVELRERFAVRPDQLKTALEFLTINAEITEAVILSTCNRTEIALVVSHTASREVVVDQLERLLAQVSGLQASEFAKNIYYLEEQNAVRHLFKVACGLDSMILGEPQVLGQLKTAFRSATEVGATGALLNGLFQQAFSVAKSVRTQTAIGANAVSVCYAAKELACQIFGDLSEATVLLIGTGETGQLALKHLRSAGANKFIVGSRSLQRAADVAGEFSGVALEVPPQSVATFLSQADIIVGAMLTAATVNRPGENETPVISREQVQASQKIRRGRPQFFIDLAVPRNFAPEISEFADVFLYNVDDLGEVVRQNLDSRAVAVVDAERLVESEVEEFSNWRELRRATLPLRDVQRELSDYQEAEIAKTLKRLKRLGYSERDCQELTPALYDLTKAIAGKSLHRPVEKLRKDGQSPEVRNAFFDFFSRPRFSSRQSALRKSSSKRTGSYKSDRNTRE